MGTSTTPKSHLPRDNWLDACGAVVFLSFLMIVAHVAFPPLFGVMIPYAGGAAVVLGIGATLCLGLSSQSARLAATVGLSGLLGIRTLSGLRPDLLIANHGVLSMIDGIAMTLLIFASVALIGFASRRFSPRPDKPMQPTSFVGGC